MPGGTQETQFKLINEGSMNIESITLNTSYDIVDKGEPNNR